MESRYCGRCHLHSSSDAPADFYFVLAEVFGTSREQHGVKDLVEFRNVLTRLIFKGVLMDACDFHVDDVIQVRGLSSIHWGFRLDPHLRSRTCTIAL